MRKYWSRSQDLCISTYSKVEVRSCNLALWKELQNANFFTQNKSFLQNGGGQRSFGNFSEIHPFWRKGTFLLPRVTEALASGKVYCWILFAENPLGSVKCMQAGQGRARKGFVWEILPSRLARQIIADIVSDSGDAVCAGKMQCKTCVSISQNGSPCTMMLK